MRRQAQHPVLLSHVRDRAVSHLLLRVLLVESGLLLPLPLALDQGLVPFLCFQQTRQCTGFSSRGASSPSCAFSCRLFSIRFSTSVYNEPFPSLTLLGSTQAITMHTSVRSARQYMLRP